MSESPILQMLVSGQNDLTWYQSNLKKLKSKYNNKFIAFHNKEVIDVDKDFERLTQKLQEKNIDTSNIFIKFVGKIKAIL